MSVKTGGALLVVTDDISRGRTESGGLEQRLPKAVQIILSDSE